MNSFITIQRFVARTKQIMTFLWDSSCLINISWTKSFQNIAISSYPNVFRSCNCVEVCHLVCPFVLFSCYACLLLYQILCSVNGWLFLIVVLVYYCFHVLLMYEIHLLPFCLLLLTCSVLHLLYMLIQWTQRVQYVAFKTCLNVIDITFSLF